MNGFLARFSGLKENFFGNREEVPAGSEPALPVSDDLAELEELGEDRPNDGFEMAIPEPDEVSYEDGRREYSGMPGNYQVVIRPVYNHIFLSRKYGTHGQPSIKMSWRFNQYGRIDLVDARMLPEKDVYHLIKVRHFEQMAEPWDSAIAFHYRLPDRVNLLNPGFKDLRVPRQYQSLLRFGHSMARDVIQALEGGRVRDSYVLGEQQSQLREIVEDETALVLLKQASQAMPSSKMLNRSVMKVYYEG